MHHDLVCVNLHSHTQDSTATMNALPPGLFARHVFVHKSRRLWQCPQAVYALQLPRHIGTGTPQEGV